MNNVILFFASYDFNPIWYAKNYPKTHDYGIPRQTQSMKAYKILTEYFWEFEFNVALWECCKHTLYTSKPVSSSDIKTYHMSICDE